jgi:acetyl-CoA acetyltransferase
VATVNKMCGSGMQAAIMAADKSAGSADIVGPAAWRA